MPTLVFAAFLLADIALRFWLASRQARHVLEHRDQVPAAFADRISLSSHQRAADYTMARLRLGMIERVTDAAVLVGLTLMGGLQWLDITLARHIDSEMLRQLALVGAVAGLLALRDLPFSWWRTFRLEARFGFNRMTAGLFFTDLAKGVLVTLLLGAPLVAAILWLMGHGGPHWAWWAWGVWIVFNLTVLWLFPTVIAPLFNRFEPLDRPELAERIHALSRRCGFALKDLQVMDGSRRSAHGNAYFTGFGRNRRIVFFDTLLNRLAPDEIEAVLAHELGHFKHRHILRRIGMAFLTALVLLQGLAWLANQPTFYTALGVVPQLGRANDAMALILFILVLPVFTFWLTPLASWVSRRDEYQADRYAATQSSPQSLVSALVKLHDDNAATLTPDPLHSAFYDSHPPAALRIARLTVPAG